MAQIGGLYWLIGLPIGCRCGLGIPSPFRWFAGTQIRNVSALGGNIVTGSPISDLNPVWMASGATFTAISQQGGERTVLASQFFLGYR